MIRTRTVAVLISSVLIGVLTASCTPGWNSTVRKPELRSAEQVRTDPSRMGSATLVVWDQEVRGGQQRQIVELNEEFEKRYPNIRIKRVARSFDDLRTTSKLALTGEDPPDVLQVNNGKQDMGAFVRSGLLLPLDGYAQAHGWTHRYTKSVLRLSRYNGTGRTLGEGHLFGMPQTGELVGMYYNTDKLRDLGFPPPKTWEEFDAALRAAKRAGEVPIQFGNLEKSSGIHLFGFAQNRHVPADEINRLATGAQGASWETERNRKAAQQVRQWAANGYLTPGFAGKGEDSAWRDFASGEGLFHISGSWLLADLQEAMGDSVGFRLPPSHGGASTVTGGTGVPFAVSSGTEHPDAAAAYVDFITSREAMKTLLKHDNVPVIVDEEVAGPALTSDVVGAWRTASESGNLVPYLDYATVTAYDTVTDATERLLAGNVTPQDFLRRMQRDVEAAG